MNRSDARRDLLALSEQLHRCFERAGNFRVIAAGSSMPCTNLPSTNAEGTYIVVFAPGEPTASGFRIAARPLGAQEGDSGCGALTLDELGNRGITGSREPVDCWQESDD
jgi:type IV pilus assembly protein PilE